jgi:hypothetical protein
MTKASHPSAARGFVMYLQQESARSCMITSRGKDA